MVLDDSSYRQNPLQPSCQALGLLPCLTGSDVGELIYNKDGGWV